MTRTELVFYAGILEDLNGKKSYSDYEILRKDLLIEFKIKTTIEELRSAFNEQLEQPTLEEEVEDLKMMYQNVR